MGSQHSPEGRPTAEWIGRFAGHTITLMPDVSPLDAVRRALAAHSKARLLSPEEAAERQADVLNERASLGAMNSQGKASTPWPQPGLPI